MHTVTLGGPVRSGAVSLRPERTVQDRARHPPGVHMLLPARVLWRREDLRSDSGCVFLFSSFLLREEVSVAGRVCVRED